MSTQEVPLVTVLTSAIGLGVYIPALLIQRQLCQLGVSSDVEVLERYYSFDSQRRHLAHKEAFHKDFALAVLANRMARSAEGCLDHDRIGTLLSTWAFQRREHFIVWSGFWLPVLEEYRKMAGRRSLNVDICRIDAEISASFRAHPGLELGGADIWLWNWAEKKIVREIPVTSPPPATVPFNERENRLIVHGGGWGLGTYRATLPELERTRYALDVVVQNIREVCRHRAGDRHLMIDPEWQPWLKESDNQYSFPGMGEVMRDGEVRYHRNAVFHGLYNLIRYCKAIVSKPGGCTLIDSLNSATPLIILDPYGPAEASNGALWEYLGFGVSLPAWRASGYSESLLAELHSNITARPSTGLDYPRELVDRLTQKGGGTL